MKQVSCLFSAVSTESLRERSDWSLGPVGRHRDSDALERSNFRVVTEDLAKTDPTGEDYSIERFGHWGVGWVEEIITRPGSKAEACALEWEAALADYPVADDTDYSNEETEEAEQVWTNCYDVKSRIEYVRDNRSEFEFSSFADMLGCIRGLYFGGYASELIER